MDKQVYVVFSSINEIIVTTPEREKDTIKAYFEKGGRDIEDYDKEEVLEEAVCISSRVILE